MATQVQQPTLPSTTAQSQTPMLTQQAVLTNGPSSSDESLAQNGDSGVGMMSPPSANTAAPGSTPQSTQAGVDSTRVSHPSSSQTAGVSTTPAAAPAASAQQRPAPVPYQHQQMGSLYVGDLAPEVSEHMLYEKFSACGMILSIRVCRDVVTHRSLGYAYINFSNVTDAERALDTMNYDSVNERPIRIMWSMRDPTLRKTGLGNIFIKNLDKNIDNKALYDTFSAFGNILSCKIAEDEKSESKGFGFVHFETEESAKKAIENVNGKLLNGIKVYVGPFIARKQRTEVLNQGTFTNVYVKGFRDFLTEEQLSDLFGKCGTIQSLKIMRDPSGKSKGFGFVNYTEHEEAERAVRELNEYQITPDTPPLYVARAQRRAERESMLREQFQKIKTERSLKAAGTNLYFKNVEDSLTEQNLRDEFSKYGTIVSITVVKDKMDRSRGFGYVCFDTVENAKKAKEAVHNKILHQKPLYVDFHMRRDERRVKLMQYYTGRSQVFKGQASPGGGNVPLPGWGSGGPMPNGFAPFPFNPQANTFINLGPHGRFDGPGPVPPGLNPALNGFHPLFAPSMLRNQFAAAAAAAGAFQSPARMPGPVHGIPSANQFNAALQLQAHAMLQNTTPLRQQQMQQGAGARASQPPTNMGVANFPMPGLQQQQYLAALPFSMGMASSLAAMGQLKASNATVVNVQQPLAAKPGPNGDAVAFNASAKPVNATQPQQIQGAQPLSATALAQASLTEQKQMLGERLFPLVAGSYPTLAGKITGMLLEMDNTELLHMLENPDVLRSKCDEAYEVLQAHQRTQTQGQVPNASAPIPPVVTLPQSVQRPIAPR